jgi:hypothetical protein
MDIMNVEDSENGPLNLRKAPQAGINLTQSEVLKLLNNIGTLRDARKTK